MLSRARHGNVHFSQLFLSKIVAPRLVGKKCSVSVVTFFFSFSFLCVYIQGDGTQDITEVMSDTDFIQNVLKNLPGVDPSSEAIQKVMVSLAQQDSEDSKGKDDQDEPMGEEDTDKDKKKDKE